jgi:threonine synthase
MWKAFDEMEELGWLPKEAQRPRMIAVQAEGCAPIVKAWDEGKPTVEMWQDASTIAAGLRVPRPYGDYLVLDILKRSLGTAVAVSDDEIKLHSHWGRTGIRRPRRRRQPRRLPQTARQRISLGE